MGLSSDTVFVALIAKTFRVISMLIYKINERSFSKKTLQDEINALK